jgi:glucuronide carrier protein
MEQLSEIRTPDLPLAGVTAPNRGRKRLTKAAWFPVVSDGFASNVGVGASDEKTMAATLATSGAMRVLVTVDPPAIPSGLWCYRVGRRQWLLGGAVNDVGRADTWLRSTLNLAPTEGPKQYLYMYISYILLGTLYSLVNIPYGSLATAMTQDPIERSRLGVWRSMGPIFGILVLVLVIAPKITQYKKDPHQLQSFFTGTTLAFVVIGFLLYMVTFFTCREQVPHEAKPVTIKDTLRTFRPNSALQILCVSNLVYLIGVFGVQGAQAYYAAYVLGNSEDLIPMILASTAAVFVSVPIVPRLVARIGKKATFMAATALMIAAGIWIFFLPVNLSLVVVAFFVFGLGQNMAMSLLFAFEADAVEYGEYQTGQRTEGATYAIYSFFRKMSQALSASLVGYALTAGSFAPKAASQPDSAIRAIKVVMGLSPAVFGLLGVAIFAFYPLTDDRFREIVRDLRARTAEELEHVAGKVAP